MEDTRGLRTDDIEVARRRAFQKTRVYNRIHKCNESPAIVIVTFEFDLLKQFSVKNFKFCDEEWLNFVLANRLSKSKLVLYNDLIHNHDLKYEVVFGPIADGKVSELANYINKGNIHISSVRVSDILTNQGRPLGMQMSLHTKASLKCIINMNYIELDEGRK